jgi:hypothetical protein
MKHYIGIVFLSTLFIGCNVKSSKPLSGGVYVATDIIKNRNINHDSIRPILALRIDKINSDTLFVKYRFGTELSADIDFEYKDSCYCYISLDKMMFAPTNENIEKERVFLKFKNHQEIELFYLQNKNKKTQQYKLTYIDTVDLLTHRDVYHAEEGFKLFSN